MRLSISEKSLVDEAKHSRESTTTLVAYMMPSDANPSGNVFGGVLMKLIDQVGSIVATRHSRCRVVTASIDRMDFLKPVYIGDVVTLKASLDYVGRTSMEVGVRIEAENPQVGDIRQTGSCFIIYVALDAKGSPKEVPSLILETEEDRKHWAEGEMRRRRRLSEIGRLNLPG